MAFPPLSRRKEVSHTSRKTAQRFGGYRIKIDQGLSEVTGFRLGTKVVPSELTKGLWRYIKKKKLGGKIN